MKLRELLKDVPVRATHGDPDLEISAVTSDSRLAVRGSLFVAIPGTRDDGAKYINSAKQKGAVAIVAERGQATVEVDDPRAALALIAANFYGRPANKLSLIGVTGTSGKTTTTKMVESILDASGKPAGLIGTIEYRAGDETLVADRTTPDAVVLQQWFAKMVQAKVKYAVMEVSSHALSLKRTWGIRFSAAVFTNLSHEHLDFHKNMDDYFAAKRTLFDQIESPDRAVINRDDEYGKRLIRDIGGKPLTFGMRNADILPAKDFEISTRGLRGTLDTPAGPIRVESPLLGRPNLYNWMAAVGAAIAAGLKTKQIESGIRDLPAVRGRFEYVDSNGGPTVIVDYAHKPDALEKLLHAVRDLAGKKRVVVVFGCGGDRDKEKRPKMGAIATQLADFTILTSDNPRSEKADQILDDIERGARGSGTYARITERRSAIGKAIEEAGKDDVIVIAGKGHENYQVIGDQIVHFDDKEEAEIALKKRNEKGAPKSV